MPNARLELNGELIVVPFVEAPDPQPLLVPMIGGGSYWQRPDSTPRRIALQGPAASQLTGSVRLAVDDQWFVFRPVRLSTSGLIGELIPASS